MACVILVSLKSNRFQLLTHDVHLCVSDGEDVAVCKARSRGISIDLELHPVLRIDQPLTVAVHGGVGHGAQVDPEAELVAGKILGQRHVGSTISRWFEVAGYFLPHVTAVETLVTHPIWHAVDRHLHFSYVGIEEVFRVPSPWCEGVNEEEQDALERPALGVHPQVEVGVRASCDGNHLCAHDEVVRELLATSIGAHHLFSKVLTSYNLVL